MRDGATNSRNSRWIGAIAEHAKGGRWRNAEHALRQFCRPEIAQIGLKR
jgi:hypothetical protein